MSRMLNLGVDEVREFVAKIIPILHIKANPLG